MSHFSVEYLFYIIFIKHPLMCHYLIKYVIQASNLGCQIDLFKDIFTISCAIHYLIKYVIQASNLGCQIDLFKDIFTISLTSILDAIFNHTIKRIVSTDSPLQSPSVICQEICTTSL